jgi:hypothetical protein
MASWMRAMRAWTHCVVTSDSSDDSPQDEDLEMLHAGNADD